MLLAVLFYFCPGPCLAAEPLRLELLGLDGGLRANVEAALAFPPGLVRDGQIDRRWMARFVEQVPQQVTQAMQPFGYFNPTINTRLDETDGTHLLRVQVEPGEPVRVTKLRVEVTGPGTARGL